VDCEVRVAPRQLRVHATTRTTFHVAAASGPIVEDCDGLRFAPYAATWGGADAGADADAAYDAAAPATTFDVLPGAWREVKDFKWLKNEPSPHWAPLADFAAAVPAVAADAAAALGLRLLTPP